MRQSPLGAALILPQPGRRRLVVIAGLIGVAVLVVALVVSGELGRALLVGDIVLFLSCFGIARAGICCNEKGVAVQGLTLTHRFTWAEIVRFEYREFHGIGVVQRRGGWIQLVGPRMFGDLSEETTAHLEQQRHLHQNPESAASVEGHPYQPSSESARSTTLGQRLQEGRPSSPVVVGLSGRRLGVSVVPNGKISR